MMFYPTSVCIIFSLRKLKFYEGQWPGAGGRGPDTRARGRIIQTPTLKHLLLFEICAGVICEKLLYNIQKQLNMLIIIIIILLFKKFTYFTGKKLENS